MSNTPSPHRIEVVEAVAEGIWRSQIGDAPGDHEWLNLPLWMQDDYRNQALAAIEAHTAALGGGLIEEWRAWGQDRAWPTREQALADRRPLEESLHARKVYRRFVTPGVAVPDSGSGHE